MGQSTLIPGNRNPSKLNTKEARQAAFMAFCDHMAAGYSIDTFHKPCVYNTVMKMIKEFPAEFDLSILEMARAEGRHQWESIGKLGTMGKLKGFNATSWWRIMQNKLGWKDNVQLGGDKDNPIGVGGAGALSPLQEAVLDHIGKKLIYERNLKAGSSIKGKDDSE